MKTKSLLDHCIFWSVLLASFAVIPFFQEGNSASLLSLIVQNIKRLPAMLIAAYTFNEFLIPQYYEFKKYHKFTIGVLALFYLTSALDRFINVYVYEPLFRKPPFEQESVVQIVTDISFLITGYLPPLLIAAFAMLFERVVRSKRIIENQNIELERDKNRAELNALKSQLHPHFLFNTLNNLYTLTIQKSDKAPETVITLSAMLDYMLYQCNDNVVPLSKEIELLENYISLELLRYGEEIEITFNKPAVKTVNENCSDPLIAPLLLLSIVENAFKHGASGSIKKPQIHIELSLEGSTLLFNVKNTKNEGGLQVDSTGYSKGIGVSNITQQLALLYSDFSYDVTDTNGWYCVALRLNTANRND